MNKRNTPYMNDDKASIGIGAMIVFIALILVAAVASTIIIKTAEELQQRAEATGDDTRDEISGKMTIISAHVNGIDAAGATDTVDNVLVVAQMSAGSDDVIAGDIDYLVICDAGGATTSASTDQGDITTTAAEDIDENALAATDTISSGTTILFEIALDECDQPAGGAVELRIIINGGGETYAQMEISEVELGAVLV